MSLPVPLISFVRNPSAVNCSITGTHTLVTSLTVNIPDGAKSVILLACLQVDETSSNVSVSLNMWRGAVLTGIGLNSGSNCAQVVQSPAVSGGHARFPIAWFAVDPAPLIGNQVYSLSLTDGQNGNQCSAYDSSILAIVI